MSQSNLRDRSSAGHLIYDGADHVIDAETKHLEQWRGRKPAVGLALSGGGIRSATYCLGVLQALAHKEALPNVDYLSTVSGGGYIGASLTYLLHQAAHDKSEHPLPQMDVSKENFPYVSYPMVGVGGPEHAVTSEQARQEQKLKGRLLRRLRQCSNYLAPGDGITLLSLSGAVMRNVVTGAALHLALMVVVFQLFFMFGWFTAGKAFDSPLGTATWPSGASAPGWNVFLICAGVLALAHVAVSALYVPLTRFFDYMEKADMQLPYRIRRMHDITTHCLLAGAITLLVIGALPWVHALVAEYELLELDGWKRLFDRYTTAKPLATGSIATLVGVIGTVWGFVRSGRESGSSKKPRIPTGLIVGVASAALLFGLMLLVYIFTGWVQKSEQYKAALLWAAAVVIVVFGVLPAANYVSLHSYYRDRLLELFLPDLQRMREAVKRGDQHLPPHRFMWRWICAWVTCKKRTRKRLTRVGFARIGMSRPGDSTLLGDLCGAPQRDQPKDVHEANHATAKVRELRLRLRGPYHILNASVALVASHNPRYRARGSENYIFSPLYCGSRATNWTKTDASRKNGYTLATAMAISGAALNPNAGPGGQGITRQPVLSVLMGMLNLRLGHWTVNPRYATRSCQVWRNPTPIFPGLFESFARFNLNEHARYSLLTDGGHFENLGLYELVRRRLKLIIVCDATADPDFKFTDLANAIQKVRADFGAIIELNAEQLAKLVPGPGDEAKSSVQSAGSDASQATARPEAADCGYLIVPIRYSAQLPSDTDHTGATSGSSTETPSKPSTAQAETGTLILLKATVFKGLPADLFSYRCDEPNFPNQSTVDQFFDERQFDAYRELGYKTAFGMLTELEAHLAYDAPSMTVNTKKGYNAPTCYAVASMLLEPVPQSPDSKTPHEHHRSQ